MSTLNENHAVVAVPKGDSQTVPPSLMSHSEAVAVANEAATKVLAITEVVEAILMNLPLRNILGVRRVCRNWNDVLGASQALQRKTFHCKAWDTYVIADVPTSTMQLNEVLTPVAKTLHQQALSHASSVRMDCRRSLLARPLTVLTASPASLLEN